MTAQQWLTQSLRAARAEALRQKYLDVIQQAQSQKEQDALHYAADTNAAYQTKMRRLKTAPQKLSAMGLGGGYAAEENAGILAEYEETLLRLQSGMAQSLRDFEAKVEKQTRLMQNALAQYGAQTALEDAKSTRGKTARAGSNTAAVPAPPTQSRVLVPQTGAKISAQNGIRVIVPPRRSRAR